MSRPRFLLVFAALALLAGRAAEAVPAPAALDGVVRGPDGAPLAGVLVRLDGGAPAATDEGGRFRLEAPPGGHRVWPPSQPLLATWSVVSRPRPFHPTAGVA